MAGYKGYFYCFTSSVCQLLCVGFSFEYLIKESQKAEYRHLVVLIIINISEGPRKYIEVQAVCISEHLCMCLGIRGNWQHWTNT